MANWHNKSGRPLSSPSWLITHHQAKLPERRRFVHRLLERKPRTIVDLGCGIGLWLSLINEMAPLDCCLIGLDSDEAAIQQAKKLSSSWNRPVEFRVINLEDKVYDIPTADQYLCFNVFPYLNNPVLLMNKICKAMKPNGLMAIRQYDGDQLRFGPMDRSTRRTVNTAIEASVGQSKQFRHFDMDRVYKSAAKSNFGRVTNEFELLYKCSPYDNNFLNYFRKSIEWYLEYVSREAAESLQDWLDLYLGDNARRPSYWLEVDLVTWLS